MLGFVLGTGGGTAWDAAGMAVGRLGRFGLGRAWDAAGRDNRCVAASFRP
jgi:hypothetical protein